MLFCKGKTNNSNCKNKSKDQVSEGDPNSTDKKPNNIHDKGKEGIALFIFFDRHIERQQGHHPDL